jgi:hypothetical protein
VRLEGLFSAPNALKQAPQIMPQIIIDELIDHEFMTNLRARENKEIEVCWFSKRTEEPRV